jgi:pilus assembly protein Flp/PilA
MRSLIRNEKGATAIEYGLLAALIAVVIVAAVVGIGTSLNNTFDHIKNCLTNATTCTSGT